MYYGYRKVTYVLRRKYNLKRNKKVRRLMRGLNLTSIIDVYDREIVSFSTDLSDTGKVDKQVMLNAIYERELNGTPNGLVLRTNNGNQFISGIFEEACLNEHFIHERILVRSPNYNAFIESYHRYLQYECLTGSMYYSIDDIKKYISDFVYRYNNERIHSAIEYVFLYEYYIKNIS